MKKKIMIVDDEHDIIDLTRTIFEMGGYEVISAYSGKECLKKLDKEKVDLIILDILMPGMSGWDVAAKIKEKPKWEDIPIVFLTAKDDEMSIGVGGLASEDYIVKPFDKETLLNRVDKILKR